MRATRALAALFVLLASLGCGRPGIEIEYRAGRSFSEGERRAIAQIAERAALDVRQLLPTLPAQLRITVQAGSQVIPETGDTGGIGLPGAVYWTVDPTHRGGVIGVANAQLRATLFHEWYHLVREAHVATESLVDRAVNEGLATAFERDFGGRATPWGTYPADVERWTEEFLALPPDASVRDWMNRHTDGRRWIGYKVGTSLADRARQASGQSLAQLATVPTEQIVSWALGR
jgi:uncharacterized protein YjaZ